MSSRPEVLLIGHSATPLSAPRLTWEDAARHLPELAQYSEIVVVPESGTQEHQDSLLEVLEKRLAYLRKTQTVVWVCNEHTITRVADVAGVGTLQKVGNLDSGEIVSALPTLSIQRAAVCYVVTPSRNSGTPLVIWRRTDHGLTLPLAVLSGSSEWLLAAPAEQLSGYLNARKHINRAFRQVAAVAIITLLLLSASTWRTVTVLKEAERDVRSSLVVPSLPPRQDVALLSTVWLTAEGRLATRILTSHYSQIKDLLPSVSAGQNPYKLWVQAKKSPEKSSAFFVLALLIGDLSSAFQIVRENDFEDYREEWHQLTTATFWQVAVEALHELDFTKAQLYTSLYIASGQRIADGSTSASELGAQRNRTLARILLRELRSDRIRSLCGSHGVRRSFGRLLGVSTGQSLPAEEPAGLADVRRKNMERFCANSQASSNVDYDDLSYLEEFNKEVYPLNEAPAALLRACQIAQVECDFIKVRRALAAVGDRNAHTAALSYASRCSYLSDDMLYNTLVQPSDSDEDDAFDRTSRRAKRLQRSYLQAGALNSALKCLDETGDFNRIVRDLLETLPCSAISGLSASVSDKTDKNAYLKLVDRCIAKR